MVPPQLLYSHKMDIKHLLWWHNMSAYGSLVADGVAILITTSLVNSVCGNLPFHHWQSGRHVVLVCWNQKSLIEILVSILSIFLFYLSILLFLPPSRASLSGLLPAALQVIYYEWRHCWGLLVTGMHPAVWLRSFRQAVFFCRCVVPCLCFSIAQRTGKYSMRLFFWKGVLFQYFHSSSISHVY